MDKELFNQHKQKDEERKEDRKERDGKNDRTEK